MSKIYWQGATLLCSETRNTIWHWIGLSLDERGKPLEAICVANALNYTAHEHLDGSGVGVFVVGVFTLSLMVGESQLFAKFFFLQTSLHVNLVSENYKGDILELRHCQKAVQFFLNFFQSMCSLRIDHKDDTVDCAAVVGPGFTRLEVTSQIVRIEANVSNGDLGLMRVDCAVSLSEAILLQHVQEGGLACIIESQENNIGWLLEEAHPLESTLKEIHNEHIF